MIGVTAHEADLPWVSEFFELFKTPWEPAVPGKRYRVLLTNRPAADAPDADLAFVYAAGELPLDRRLGVTVNAAPAASGVDWKGETIPLYGRAVAFGGECEWSLRQADGTPVGYRHTCGARTIYRFGYDLFFETASLLTEGQPKSNAPAPTLELHIDIIRQCLRQARVPFVEIPPRPYGHAFVCCLTHDVDFFGVRRHAVDTTLAGFVGRATAGTTLDVIRRRRPIDEAVRNWRAAATLPLVFLGAARDFWQPFDDYRRVDRDRRSTFFLIPFKGRPGIGPDGQSRRLRAAPYGVHEIRRDIEAHTSPATEFAVHGIDAWRDAQTGAAERQELTRVTGCEQPGIRMHWLYFSATSPRTLEDAGFGYDSTWGFNDAVGFRAGTAQAFRLSGTKRLLELPLTIMDTALFYPDRMALTREQAVERCRELIQQLRRFGGSLVVNWHDRSLAPERQWTRPYQALLNELDANNVWYAKAGEAVDWFRWRREIRFAVESASRVRVDAPAAPAGLPGAPLVVHRPAAADMRAEDMLFAGGSRTIDA